jgi:signal transduction histidine kinase
MFWPPRSGGCESCRRRKVSFAGRLRLWPRSLAARTALVLLVGLAVVQGAGLTIHALDRVDLQRLAQTRDIAIRVMSLYRGIALTPPAQRDSAVGALDPTGGAGITIAADPPADPLAPTSQALQRQMTADMQLVPVPLADRPRDLLFLGGPAAEQMVIGLRLPEGRWLNVSMPMPPPRPWHSPGFLVAFLLMTAAAAVLSLWAVRRLTLPVATLAAAAEALGRDVNAPPLPQTGPTEVATAAAAFNTMAARIRRFVQDRTFMLTAIGHDLRTPITRLRLRAEFIEDDDLRGKMLADLDELEGMVSATLVFGRDATAAEPESVVDFAELARTVLDEAADARPEAAGRISYGGVTHLPVRVRPIALKRALTNLVANALNYGGSARVTLSPPQPGPESPAVQLRIDDDGPGIPPEELERVFQPFHRVEVSRNRETGGMGLGLPIARNILRAHGGDVTLENRREGGARATVLLPV